MLAKFADWALAERSPVFKSTFTLAAFALSLVARFALRDALPTGFPYLTFFPAVILTTFFAGVWFGWALAIACGVAAWYYFILPYNSFDISGLTAVALGFYVFIVATDILLIHIMNISLARMLAERRRSDQLAASRALMFHELQHRVSNNLQVIGSMLQLQRNDLEDPAARQALEVASARLRTVATIQRSLHDPNRQSVDFARFLQRIVPDIVEASGLGDRVQHRVEPEPVPIGSDQSVPLGLIATEFITNTLEHATARPGPVHLCVSLKCSGEGRAVLEVRDDGPGFPPGFDPASSRSLGLRIVLQFAAQLNGEVTMRNENGALARIEFQVKTDEASAPAFAELQPAL